MVTKAPTGYPCPIVIVKYRDCTNRAAKILSLMAGPEHIYGTVRDRARIVHILVALPYIWPPPPNSVINSHIGDARVKIPATRVDSPQYW